MRQTVVGLMWIGISTLTLAYAETVVGVDRVQAQVIPDGTLPTTVTTPNNLDFTINGGARSGNNLFHSFNQLSVPTGGSALFNNATDVQTIFARVTGGSASNIDGLLKANGTASLFLLNPSGILFGANAQLNIGGSFVGTTANSIQFADGTEFSAVNPSSPPLLTMSAPIGLQMGQNPGRITVQGQGNQLLDSTGFGTIDASNAPLGLQAGTNQTLALIGGDVTFSGGIATTNGGGHLEVGSVRSGQVGLNPTSTGWTGNYSTVQQFNDIHLANQSLLNASNGTGSIHLQGQNVRLSEGSAALIQNFGTQPSGGITVHATGSLSLAGNTANNQMGSLIEIDNFGTNQTGEIAISAAQFSLQDGARIMTSGIESAGGNITANVSGTAELSGVNYTNPFLYSGIATFSYGSGNAGNITVSAKNIRILDSGEISSNAIGSGDSGTLQVNATDQVEIVGFNPRSFFESTLSTYTQGSGNAKNAVINTTRLIVQAGGSIGSTTAFSGSAGSVEINASQLINIEGAATEGIGIGRVSRIYSNAEILSPETQALFGLPEIPTGQSGSLTINTPLLRLADGGAVSVRNDGPGRAGNLQINANSIVLKEGHISASTASGNGGNIQLNLQESLRMRYGSEISVMAKGTGDGGNIMIDAPVIVGLENSDILANADQGRGGNIQITTQGIIGLKYRDRLTPENDITASSEFGVNGTVNVNNVGVDPNSGLVELSTKLIDSKQQVATACSGTQGSSFVLTGRGGIPQNPTQQLSSDHSWNDMRDLSAFHKSAIAQTPTPTPAIVQATTWQRNSQTGKVELVAAHPTSSTPSATCASKLNSTRSPI
jgi:filamentous hemagglutinin family protein